MIEQGSIKWFKPDKKFGFIVPASGGPDVMLHVSVCQKCNYEPKQSERVLYRTEATQNGMRATWIEKAP